MEERLEKIDLKLAQELYEVVEANVKKIQNPEIGLLLVEAFLKYRENNLVVTQDHQEAFAKKRRWTWPLGFR